MGFKWDSSEIRVRDTLAVARGLLLIPKLEKEEAVANAVHHFRHPVYDSVVVYRS